LLWAYEDLPKGHSSVTFGSNSIFITGTRDTNDILVALDMNGKIRWQTIMGRAWNESYPESRATPTVEGDKVFTCSGLGDIACIDGNSGQILWSYKASEEMLNIYDEKCGNVGLLNATPEKFDKVSSFKITKGTTKPYFFTHFPLSITVFLNTI